MRYIDRYVAEVGKRLPRKDRGDLEAELRSTLADMLEDRAKAKGRAADEEMEKALLREYGAPDQVAASYKPAPYLIGPRMFPFFQMVLKIALAALAGVLLITSGIQIAARSPMSTDEFLRLAGSSLLGLLQAGIQAFGNVVLVFAILERFVPASEFKVEHGKEWDPELLMKSPEPDEVKPWGPIAEIVFTAAALIVFNFYPQILGGLFLVGEEWLSLAVLSEAFFRWLPWINLIWALEIGLNLMLLREGRRTTASHVVSLTIKVMQIVIGFFLLTGPSIVALTPEAIGGFGIFSSETAQLLGSFLQLAARSLLGLIMLLAAIDAATTVYRLFTRSRSGIARH
jgi:hypothetical protein